ncbi:trna delta -isopentenylpyrophosphate transferase [Chelativorans xinjiangense]|uniref:trna delta -isopentenylpyrophosphate transferase n=1 Tax=Chelativorans xinjiangense TaxID=2681485 RepID=UPI00135A421E|nr:trna delta -isopentenylpyrophosphate transferase [Chelativorans xinjiangense]
MTKNIDPRLIEILTEYGESPNDALWDCHGTWVAYHKAIERIAAKAGVVFDMPQIIEANSAGKTVAIAVSGKMGDRQEWSFGEAAPSNNKNAYPYAMAEKRAKDRVVLKLVGLHGLVYSEEESDDFKPGGAPQEPPHKSSAALKREGAWPAVMEQFHADIQDVKTLMALEAMKASYRAQAKKDGWTTAWLSSLANEFDTFEEKLIEQMEKEDA